MARVRRRPDGPVEVHIGTRRPLVLPVDLAELFIALTSHRSAAGDRDLVAFKSSQFLVHELGNRLNTIVTRAQLRRLVARLRRALALAAPDGSLHIESRHGLGWRIPAVRLDRFPYR